MLKRLRLIAFIAVFITCAGLSSPFSESSSHPQEPAQSAPSPAASPTPTPSPRTNKKTVVRGLIVDHVGADTLLVRTPEGIKTEVTLTLETRFVERKRNPIRSAKRFERKDLLRGLAVEIEAIRSANKLLAQVIRFSQADLRIARVVDGLLEEPSSELLSVQLKALTVNVNKIDQAVEQLSGQMEEWSAVANAARGGLRAVQESADKANAQIVTVEKSVDTLRTAQDKDTKELTRQLQALEAKFRSLSANTPKPNPTTGQNSNSNDGNNANTNGNVNATDPSDIRQQFDAANEISKRLLPGKLLHDIPNQMQIDVERPINISIVKEVTNEIESRFQTAAKDIKIAPLMSVALVSKDGAFEVVKQFPVDDSQIVGQDEAQWLFKVKPIQPGKHDLILYATVRLNLPGQGQHPRNITVVEAPITVEVGSFYYPWVFIKTNWEKLSGLIVGSGLVGVFVTLIKRRRRPEPDKPWQRIDNDDSDAST